MLVALQAACGAVVLGAMGAVMAVPLHPALRSVLRPPFLLSAHHGLSAVTAAQRLRGPLLSALVAVSSATVGWGYYLTGLPTLMWLVDAELGVQSVWLMFVATWLGNGLKDLLSAPRPLEIASEASREQWAKSMQSIDAWHSKECWSCGSARQCQADGCGYRHLWCAFGAPGWLSAASTVSCTRRVTRTSAIQWACA
mmetsp:Transcript_35885/g.101617  ORF Transcript_35885/g.101617 Transcript_35885/m.101617 type:complete len:197 (-) Transcript_35885:1763-2353(-)